MKVAVIGAGTMGTVHAEAYAAMQGVQLVAVMDPRLDAAGAVAAPLNARSYATWDELINSEEIDVVDVCVPTYLHRQYTELAASARRHVICEKPLARTLADARAMIDACQAAGVHLFPAKVVRFFPEYERAKRAVEEGLLGKPGVVRTTRAGKHPSGWNDWYASYRLCGGVILDVLIHDFDWLRAIFGEVERVFTRSLRGRGTQRLDYALVTLRFKSGVIAHLEGSWAHREKFHTRFEVCGSQGIIEYDSRQAVPICVQLDKAEAGSAKVAIPESPSFLSPYYRELEHFIQCIRTGEAPRVTAADAYKALEIAAAAMLSATSGRPTRPGEEEAQ